MEILVLLDSGSSASFLSHRVAAHLPTAKPMLVQVANETQMSCVQEGLMNTRTRGALTGAILGQHRICVEKSF